MDVHCDLRWLAVSYGVVGAFLHDAEYRLRVVGRQSIRKRHADIEQNFGMAPPPESNNVFHGRSQAEFQLARRAKLPNDRPHMCLDMRDHLADGLAEMGCLSGADALHSLGINLERK